MSENDLWVVRYYHLKYALLGVNYVLLSNHISLSVLRTDIALEYNRTIDDSNASNPNIWVKTIYEWCAITIWNMHY